MSEKKPSAAAARATCRLASLGAISHNVKLNDVAYIIDRETKCEMLAEALRFIARPCDVRGGTHAEDLREVARRTLKTYEAAK